MSRQRQAAPLALSSRNKLAGSLPDQGMKHDLAYQRYTPVILLNEQTLAHTRPLLRAARKFVKDPFSI
jgi:hypothetical protein